MQSSAFFSSTQNLRKQLRKQMRLHRLTLSNKQQQDAAYAIISSSQALIDRHQAHHIGLYMPFNGEISPLALAEHLRKQGKKIYFPVLHPFADHQLLFLRNESEQDLEYNRFGILQPKLDVTKIIPINELEMLFVPLVACDRQGNRLGMGGGFYDRTLAQAPHLISIGLAHSFQVVKHLPCESWDMPLTHLIIGESE